MTGETRRDSDGSLTVQEPIASMNQVDKVCFSSSIYYSSYSPTHIVRRVCTMKLLTGTNSKCSLSISNCEPVFW